MEGTLMTDIHGIKEAALASLEAVIARQQFGVGTRRIREADSALVISFQTLPESPDQLAVELSVSRTSSEPLKSGRSFRIRVMHARELESAAPNDISLEISESEYVKFLNLCVRDQDSLLTLSLSETQKRELDGICSLCVCAIELLRKTKRRLDGCPVPSYSSEAAMGAVGDSLAKMQEAHALLEQILTGTEPDERAIEYHVRVVEDR